MRHGGVDKTHRLLQGFSDNSLCITAIAANMWMDGGIRRSFLGYPRRVKTNGCNYDAGVPWTFASTRRVSTLAHAKNVDLLVV